MPDVETGYAFRKDMYARRKAVLPKGKPPRKVLLMLRGRHRRKIANLPELLKIIESYNFTYRYDRHSFIMMSPGLQLERFRECQ